jgi:hypothetical protein
MKVVVKQESKGVLVFEVAFFGILYSSHRIQCKSITDTNIYCYKASHTTDITLHYVMKYFAFFFVEYIFFTDSTAPVGPGLSFQFHD